MNADHIANAPKGFEFAESESGNPSIQYRTRGSWGVGIFFIVWLMIWTPGCLLLTYRAFTAPPLENVFFYLFMIPFWIGEYLAIKFVLWHFFSVTTFEVEEDCLKVSRRLFRFKKERAFPIAQIEAIQQVKDGGDGEDSFPTWGLVVEGEKDVAILSRQPIEKSEWLGPILADWIGVEYRTAAGKKEYESF